MTKRVKKHEQNLIASMNDTFSHYLRINNICLDLIKNTFLVNLTRQQVLLGSDNMNSIYGPNESAENSANP